ncbi:hypothetical protein J6W34_04990 [bacterium]|nr:hypothetical protein [bacterium]
MKFSDNIDGAYFFDNIDDAYYILKDYLTHYGDPIEDQRGDKVFQAPIVTLGFRGHIQEFAQVRSVKVPNTTILNFEGLIDYSKQLQDGAIHDFVYTYGNRLMEHFNVNQYQVIIDKISDDINTRRAIAVTYDATIDSELEDIPCLILIKCSVYDDCLFMTVVFRSNDIKYAFSSNMYALMNIQLMIAKKLGLKIGDFYYVGLDSHWKVK